MTLHCDFRKKSIEIAKVYNDKEDLQSYITEFRNSKFATMDMFKEHSLRVKELGKTIINKKLPIQMKNPKIGRNDPCSCGSNRKFKQCCGK